MSPVLRTIAELVPHYEGKKSYQRKKRTDPSNNYLPLPREWDASNSTCPCHVSETPPTLPALATWVRRLQLYLLLPREWDASNSKYSCHVNETPPTLPALATWVSRVQFYLPLPCEWATFSSRPRTLFEKRPLKWKQDDIWT